MRMKRSSVHEIENTIYMYIPTDHFSYGCKRRQIRESEHRRQIFIPICPEEKSAFGHAILSNSWECHKIRHFCIVTYGRFFGVSPSGKYRCLMFIFMLVSRDITKGKIAA